jgi:catechol 2,3-dioxygenase-like lactoylglutathione lyase family enzyme
MEATLQFYCGILGMRLVRTTRTPDGRRHYNVEIGGGNAFAVFDGAELPTAGERQHVNHLALPVDTSEEFDAAYQRLKDHGVAVTEIIERGYGKTFARAAELGRRWSELPPARTRAVLTALIERVEVHVDQVDIHLRPTRLSALLDAAVPPSQSVLAYRLARDIRG